ncbi:NUDIX domain-containing protein [Amycolatopsis sp. ATCC 39116]|uniref:NUDIX domain-containing protein n=1 Tax=Amycolatopsis sp. (strain ATCC 39116 / 75iv2) TaxID=385957 RepID=UPI0002625902
MIMEQYGWTLYGTRTVYRSPWIQVDLADIRSPSGDRFEHAVARLQRIAIALLVNERDEALMLRRHRFAVDKWGYELLGGLVEPDEDPAAAAAREALEESGYRVLGEPEHLATYEPLPGMITAETSLYLWRRFERVQDPSDPDEAGTLSWIPVTRVPEMTRTGQLLGAGTLIALYAFLHVRGADPSAIGG